MPQAIEFCEQNIVSGMTSKNFNDFLTTAELYCLSSLPQQIDIFVVNNLPAIARDGTLSLLTYQQLLHCVSCNSLCMREIDVFQVLSAEQIMVYALIALHFDVTFY